MLPFRRLLTGIPFSITAAGMPHIAPCIEPVVRLALEMRRLGRGDVAFAAVGECPETFADDCATVDRWTTDIETEVETWLLSASPDQRSFEVGAWCGLPSEEWTLAARTSEMDLLIVPGRTHGGVIPAQAATWTEQAGCSVWFVGVEVDSLSSEPPLILMIDDFTDKAEHALKAAIELAQAWSARLLVGHPTYEFAPPTAEQNDELRRTAFARLSRNDFRCISQGANFIVHAGDVDQLITEVRQTQSVNLVVWPVTGGELIDNDVLGTAHLLLWATY